MNPASEPQHVLILAPLGRDAALAAEVLHKVGVASRVCEHGEIVAEQIERGAGAALIAEEALLPRTVDLLRRAVAAQPPWSDFPFVAFGKRVVERASPQLEALLAVANVTLLERPVRIRSLLSAMRAALRARQRQYEARRAIAQRDNFLAMLGHELRNPLGAISFSSELLRRNGPLEASAARHLEVIGRQTRHLGRIIDDLLDVSRITSGKVVLQRETVDLARLVDRALDSVGDAARARIDVEKLDEPVFVTGDPVRLEQVVGNLLGNALKYTPGDGRVRITLWRQAGDAVVCVADEGIGIAPDVLPHIFDLFIQAEATIDRARGGMGIGLTVVRGLVELHDGQVEARSRGLGSGSEFFVRLPLAEPPQPPAPVPTDAAAPRSRRVLLIEDSDDIRETLRELLDSEGHRTEVAADGNAGLRLLLSNRPEVALVDIGLPGLNGYEVARVARTTLGDHVRLIALTGYGQAADKSKAHEAGFDAHLTKPVDVEVLLRLLRADKVRS